MIQSLDRGLQIIKLLSKHGPMTATSIAASLRIHQSSASRHLASLLQAGFVRKPDFHSFSLDWDALIFAGEAMRCFPAIHAAVRTCNGISSKTGCNATIAVVRNGRLLYLTRTNADASIVLVNNSDYPIHESSAGLALACEGVKDQAIAVLTGGERPITQATATSLYRRCRRQISNRGFVYLRGVGANRVNAAMTFGLGSDRAALAIFSPDRNVPPSRAGIWLDRGISDFNCHMEETDVGTDNE